MLLLQGLGSIFSRNFPRISGGNKIIKFRALFSPRVEPTAVQAFLAWLSCVRMVVIAPPFFSSSMTHALHPRGEKCRWALHYSGRQAKMEAEEKRCKQATRDSPRLGQGRVSGSTKSEALAKLLGQALGVKALGFGRTLCLIYEVSRSTKPIAKMADKSALPKAHPPADQGTGRMASQKLQIAGDSLEHQEVYPCGLGCSLCAASNLRGYGYHGVVTNVWIAWHNITDIPYLAKRIST
ncbi:hypothetical protein B0H14DRAFT_2642760 [Mycena olivaceomarginata]|nr:hypothetical protein B0H14DRAFT_2642760 [Mycena olivaceomarginata]